MEELNTDAERALHGVKSKLSIGLSVESHVNELIQEATSIDNLAVLFPGKFCVWLNTFGCF
jgi:ataxia telangiectasia mutated family protein